MVAVGPYTASPDGSGNSPRLESSSWTRVLRYCRRILLAAKGPPNCRARICRKPVDTAPSFGFDVLSVRPSVDGRLSRADGKYSSENIPGSRIGL
jgi:hypothetical protein